MARFDEFKESLKDAEVYLGGAISCLNDKGFDTDEDLYGAAYNSLTSAQEELEDALQDLSDNVGISCDEDRLKACLADLEALTWRIWSEVEGDHLKSIHFYIRAIKALQHDIERISQSAR